ncbi:MAG: hypothetical protein KDD46_04030 [Bdellovibrionales bacterium]|nr:hypothetical protein [Bdellovibrionales bacterium]
MLIKLDYQYVRPFLSKVLPTQYLTSLYSFFRPLAHHVLKNAHFESIIIEKSVHVMGLTFRNSLGVAAGFDKSGELLPFLYRLGAGYVVVGTALDQPHKGNPGTPWVPLAHSHAAINRLGLPSPGIDVVLQNIQKFREKYNAQNFPIGLSVMGHPLQSAKEKEKGMIECIRKSVGIVDFVELNQSCPNVGEDLEKLEIPLDAFTFDVPIVVKLQPMLPQKKILDLCANGKIHALVISNTQKDFDISNIDLKDQSHAQYFQKKYGGGLSGKPLLEKNLEYLKEWKRELDACGANTQLIGCGGILDHEDVVRYMDFCTLTQVYTGLWEAYAMHGPQKTWKHLLLGL